MNQPLTKDKCFKSSEADRYQVECTIKLQNGKWKILPSVNLEDVRSAVEGLKDELCACDVFPQGDACVSCKGIDKWFPTFVDLQEINK